MNSWIIAFDRFQPIVIIIPIYFLFYVLTGGKSLYNFVLVSAIQWHERVMLIHTHTHTHTHTHIPFHLSLPLLPQLHPSRSLQSTKVGSLCNLANSHCFTYDSVYMSMLLKGVAMSHERCRDSWPLEERISFQGQWWGLIAQSLCVINFY